jgi:hypothetical protein
VTCPNNAAHFQLGEDLKVEDGLQRGGALIPFLTNGGRSRRQKEGRAGWFSQPSALDLPELDLHPARGCLRNPQARTLALRSHKFVAQYDSDFPWPFIDIVGKVMSWLIRAAQLSCGTASSC